MNALVCISKTPETTARIAFTDEGTAFDTEGINYIMNPYDEWYALVRAVELKESKGGTVTLLNVGPSSNDTVIRKGLAIGADEAVRVEADADVTSLFVAKQIAEYAKDNDIDIIFMGKETIDYNGSEVGGMVAELLDVPFISYASNLEEDGDAFLAERDIEGGVEKIKVDAPFVISAAKGLAEQRIPNMRGIMMAKRKPLETIDPVEAPDYAHSVRFELPPPKGEVTLIEPDNMEELVRLLHEDAKVI